MTVQTDQAAENGDIIQGIRERMRLEGQLVDAYASCTFTPRQQTAGYAHIPGGCRFPNGWEIQFDEVAERRAAVKKALTVAIDKGTLRTYRFLHIWVAYLASTRPMWPCSNIACERKVGHFEEDRYVCGSCGIETAI